MGTNVQKNQMNPVSTGEFLSHLRDGIKVVFERGRELIRAMYDIHGIVAILFPF